MTPKSTPVPVEPEPASSDEEEPTLYFKGASHEILFLENKYEPHVKKCFELENRFLYQYLDPNQLLTLFHELEDQNLSLIQNGQDMEENVEEIKKQAQVKYIFSQMKNET